MPVRPKLYSLTAAALGIVISLVVVLALPLVDRARVQSQTELSDVRLGLPISWLVQDQSALDPEFPRRVGLASPLEHPTYLLWPEFLLNLGILSLLVCAVCLFMTRRIAAASKSDSCIDGDMSAR